MCLLSAISSVSDEAGFRSTEDFGYCVSHTPNYSEHDSGMSKEEHDCDAVVGKLTNALVNHHFDDDFLCGLLNCRCSYVYSSHGNRTNETH